MAIVYVPSVGYIETEAVPHTYAYNPDGTLLSDTMSFQGQTVKQTYTYTTVNATQVVQSTTGWIKQ
jgi:YD repeat-containing protein